MKKLLKFSNFLKKGSIISRCYGTVIDVNDDNFKIEVEEWKDELVIVDFYADWCGPCQLLKPTLKKIVQDFDGDVKLALVNVDDAKNSASEYGVSSIPAVFAIKNGEVVGKFLGQKGDEFLNIFIEDNI